MMQQEGEHAQKRWPQMMALAVLLSIPGCGGTTSEVVTDPMIAQYGIKRVAILPFTVTHPTVGQERGYATPAPPPTAAEKLADIFYVKLNAREGLTVISPHRVRESVAAIPAVPTRAWLQEFGERLGVGAVLEGAVGVYKERKGSAIGLERAQDAAEVGFGVRLVSTKDGVIIWTGEYYERQRPLTEDLSGFLERGARYLTVEELANSAVDHVLLGFPLGRPSQRTSRAAGFFP